MNVNEKTTITTSMTSYSKATRSIKPQCNHCTSKYCSRDSLIEIHRRVLAVWGAGVHPPAQLKNLLTERIVIIASDPH